jgi:pSer/pThr/pTyr-binding forkhead associated (FHA) protein
MNPEVPRGQPGQARRQVTVLESVEDLRAQIRGTAPTKAEETLAIPSADRRQDTTPYRPALRPSMALLCVLDDGDDTGEIFRIRASSLVIGRVEGDVVIPHDCGISGRHAEITRRAENGGYFWYLNDLRSTNGTFVRAASVVLHHDQELMIGSRRFRYEAPASEGSTSSPESDNVTRKWEVLPKASPGAPPPMLVDVSQGRVSQRFPLKGPEIWVGRDSQECSIVVDDPMVDRQHARIYREEKMNRWIVANNRSRNGLWARIQEVPLGRGAQFQCGEQRFVFKVL